MEETCKVDLSGWLGDGFCDDVANSEGCGYDNGDCCDEYAGTGKPEAIIICSIHVCPLSFSSVDVILGWHPRMEESFMDEIHG